jgi:hypothetical protein
VDGWVTTELVFVAIAAMLSPTTLTFSVLVLVLGDRPLRTGTWFFLGAFAATLAIGVIAAFVIGNAAASKTSEPRTWVAIADIVAAGLILAWVVKTLRSPPNPRRLEAAVEQMSRITSSPAVAVLGAGAMLANPGAFIPLALKEISELDPSPVEYIVDWVFFTCVSLLPLALALVALVVAREWAERLLGSVRVWLERNARTVAAVILVLVSLALLRNGIYGLTA